MLARCRQQHILAEQIVFLLRLGVGVGGVVVEVVRQQAAPFQLQAFVVDLADVDHRVVTVQVGGRQLAILEADVEQGRAQRQGVFGVAPAQFLVPAQLRLQADRVALVVQHIVWRRAHVAGDVVERLVAFVDLVLGAEVRQELVVAGVTFFRRVVQAAQIVAVALDVLVGDATDKTQVRRGLPAVLNPELLSRGDGVVMTPLYGCAVLVDHLAAAVVVTPHIIGCAFAIDPDKGLSLALTSTFIPIAVVQAVCFVDVPFHFGGDARAPGFGPRRAIVVERFQVTQVVVAGLVGLGPQVRRGLAAETAAVGPVIIRRDRQRQVVLQLPALSERGVDAFERVAVELVGRRQQTRLVNRGFRVVLAAPFCLELRLAQGVVVVVFLVVVLDRGQCGVAAAVFKQAAPLDLVAAQRAFAAPLVTFQVRRRDPGLEATKIAGIDPHECLAQIVGADDLFGEHPGLLGRPQSDHADVAAAGANVRAVRFRRALGGEYFGEVFRVAQLV